MMAMTAARGADPAAGAPAGLLVEPRGWRPQDRLERAALRQMRRFGPLPGLAGTGAPLPDRLPVYLAFPWSALIDALGTRSAAARSGAALMQARLRAVMARVPAGAVVATVCAHPGLRPHLGLVADAGVTDLFWPHAGPADLLPGQPGGLRLHPFPDLPEADLALFDDAAALPPPPGAPGQEAPAGEGPGGLFAFCPAGAGGNSPALWAAVGAGLIPVIAAPRPMLPGNPALWQAAAVIHDGSPEARAALPERLETLVADPAALAAMQGALTQIRLIHGAGVLVQDIQLRLIEAMDTALAGQDSPPPGLPGGVGGGGMLRALARRLGGQAALSESEAVLVLRAAASDLLLSGGGDLAPAIGPHGAAAWRAIAAARAGLPESHPVLAHFDTVLAHARSSGALRPPPPAPVTLRGVLPRVHFLGPRGQRTPLAYAPMRRLATGRIVEAETPDSADLILTGWNRDIEDNRALLRDCLAARPGLRIAVISEEPLWDSLWSGGLDGRDRVLDAGGSELRYRFLNHVNSTIFDFDRIPFFLLTADGFAARYGALIADAAARGPQALLAQWLAAPVPVAFVAERRDTEEYDRSFPAQGVHALSRHRSRIAALTPGEAVLRLGQGWPGAGPRRQSLPDWHLDKLARLHGRVRVLGAQENTLHPAYITEKPFDAFAIGALPAVIAGPGHRLHDLIDPGAMIDTHGCPPDLAAARIAAFHPDPATAGAWCDTAARLAALFRDSAALAAERRRIVDACLLELEALLQGAP